MAKKKNNNKSNKNHNHNPKDNVIQKSNLFTEIYCILFKKAITNQDYFRRSLSLCLGSFFKIVGVCGILLSFASLFPAVSFIIGRPWVELSNIIYNISFSIIALCIPLLCFLFSIMIFGAGKDIEIEQDRNYVVAVFSSTTGLVALIVALIALLK